MRTALHNSRVRPTYIHPFVCLGPTVTAIFPGYYTGRATHIHTKVFPEWTPLENGTFSGKRLAHVGQFFFEDEMNLVVDKVRFFLSYRGAWQR